MRHPTQLCSGRIDWPKIRVLVYSQDDSFRFLSRQTFRKLNVREVLSTSVPADATPMLAQAPDIALVDTAGDLDLAMAFLQRVRGADAEMPVLLVARAEDRARLVPALTLGIEGVVPKPVSGHELVHRVGDSLKEPRRLPAPPPPPAPEPKLRPPSKPIPASGGYAGSSHGSGGHGGGTAGAPMSSTRTGGSYADDTPSAKAGAGTYADASPTPTPTSGGTYADDAPSAKAGAGTYADDAPPAPPKPAKGALETLADALPDALKPKRRRQDEAAQAEAERARWQAELAETGHQSRSGEDVAGLDVDAIVAAHMQWLTSQGAEGKRAIFKKMDLAGGALGGTVLANADFREADLSDAQLAEARLDGADFRYATLNAADLSGANLGVAQLRHCDLRLANLQGASLRGADLSGARLRGAKLAGADLKGAVLVGSDLSDADLSQVDNLGQSQVDKALCDMKTKLPPGLSRPHKNDD
ncbi:MAG: pentapeptide repeat-containing protein [Bacteroidota bacterium]